jgi:hypothetical protein
MRELMYVKKERSAGKISSGSIGMYGKLKTKSGVRRELAGSPIIWWDSVMHWS